MRIHIIKLQASAIKIIILSDPSNAEALVFPPEEQNHRQLHHN